MAEHSRQRDAVVGGVLVAGSALGFAIMPVFGKVAYRHGSEPFALLSWRFVLAASLMWLILWWRCRRVRRDGARHDPMLPPIAISLRLLALGGLLLALEVALYFFGLQYLTAGIAEVLLFLFPAWVVIITALLHRTSPGGVVIACTAAAVVGAGLAVGSFASGAAAGPQAGAGVALLVGASVTYAVYVVSNSSAVAQVGSLRATTLILTGGALSFTLAAIVTGSHGPDDAVGVAMAVGMAVLSTVCAFGLLSAGLAYLSPSQASVVATLEPVLAVGLGWLFLSERPSWLQLVGVVLVVVAIVVILRSSGSTSASEEVLPEGH